MSLLDLSSVVDSLSAGNVDVYRRGASVYDSNGYATAHTYSKVATVKASVQPHTESLNRNPEGFQESNVHWAWIKFDVRDKDRIVYGGDTYEVESVDRWGRLGNYYKATLKRLAPTES